MAVNQVIKGKEVLLDLTTDTVTPYNLLAGATAHNAAGEPIEGAVVVAPIDNELSEISENAVQNKAVTVAINNKADKSDIPTSLPANGGNADTVGGLSPNIIAHGYSNSYSDANLCLKSGFYYMSSDSMSTPVYADGILVVSNIASSDSDENSISQVFFNTDGLSIASRMMIGGTFTDWKEISFAPIKSTAINGTTDTSGNIRFSAISNGMMPIFTAINNLFCTPFVSGTNYYIHIENKSGAVASTAVSGTIYYAQL